MGVFLRKYNTAIVATTGESIKIPIIKRGVVDFAVSADWTPAAGDVKVSKDGGAAASIATLPAAVTMGNAAYWEFVFSGAELSCKTLVVTIADSATKAVEDQEFIIETFGNASAMYQADLSAANLPANVTQLLGTAWLAPGTAGTPDVNAKLIGGTAQTGLDLAANWTAARAAHLDSDISSRMATFALPSNFSSLSITAGGVVKANDSTGAALATAAAVANIQNNTFIGTNVPPILERPDSSSVSVQIVVLFNDETGSPVNIDAAANPTVTLVNNAGTDLSSRLGAWSNPSAGKYTANYTNTSTDAIDDLHWDISGTVNSKSRRWVGITQVVDTTAVSFTSTDRTALNLLATQASVTALGSPMQAGAHVQLATAQDQYAPAKVGDAMTLTVAYDAAKTAAAAGAAMALTSGERTTLAGVIFASAVETGVTFLQLLRTAGAVLIGKRSNAGTATEQYDAAGNPGTARVVGNLDASGNGTPTLTP